MALGEIVKASGDIPKINVDGIQDLLDIAGLVPVVGEFADGINAVICLVRKDYVGAGLSAVSMVPVVGDVIGKGGKLIRHGDEIVGASIMVKNLDGSSADFVGGVRKGLPFNPDKRMDVSSVEMKGREAKIFDPDKKINANETSNVMDFQSRNKDLAGKNHPTTGVPFEERIVKNGDGQDISVVVPKFESSFDAQLPENLEKATDKEQFVECNRQLKEFIQDDVKLKEKFTPEQLEQIENGDTPDGYTWHHDAEKGKMQLVDSETHAKTGHTGGKAIWGGGQENR